MTLDLNPALAEDAHIAERLRTEPIAWLGSVCSNESPHQVPVWFGWYDRLVVIFSPPSARKVRNDWFAQWVQGFPQPILVNIERLVTWSKPGGELRYRVVKVLART